MIIFVLEKKNLEINRSLLVEENHIALFPYEVTSTQKYMVT